MIRNTADYPKIFIGSSELDGTSIMQAIKAHLVDENIDPRFFSFNFFSQDLIEKEQKFRKVSEADFCVLVFTEIDLRKLSEQNDEGSIKNRDFLNFLMGCFFSTLGSDRILCASSSQMTPLPVMEINGLDLTPFNTKQEDFRKSLRILCNKLVRKINSLGIRDKHELPIESEGIKVLLSHSNLKIFNEEGDSLVTRNIRIEAIEDNVNSREHHVFSDTSSSTFEEMKLKAWYKKDRELRIEKLYDTPVRKEFEVLFRNQLSKGDKLAYSYSFNWKKMFPQDGSNFTLKRTADKILFDLILPKAWELLYVRLNEKRRDGVPSKRVGSIKQINVTKEGNFIRYSYRLKSLDRNILESQVFWEWKDKNKSKET